MSHVTACRSMEGKDQKSDSALKKLQANDASTKMETTRCLACMWPFYSFIHVLGCRIHQSKSKFPKLSPWYMFLRKRLWKILFNLSVDILWKGIGRFEVTVPLV